jgi:hypothetical protein
LEDLRDLVSVSAIQKELTSSAWCAKLAVRNDRRIGYGYPRGVVPSAIVSTTLARTRCGRGLCFYNDDAAAMAEKARRAGYRIIQEPRNYDFGTEALLRIRMATPGRWYLRQKLLPAAEDAESVAGKGKAAGALSWS